MGVMEARRRILLSEPHPVATTPAPVASFDTDMVGKLRSAKFSFLPVQDLHGYDSPWPAGGGNNLLDYDTVLPSIGMTAQSDGSWYTATPSTALNKTLWENTSGTAGSVSISYTYKYNSATSTGGRFKFIYSDNTITENYVATSESYVSVSFTSNANKTLSKIDCTYGSGNVATWIKDIQVEFGAPTTWSPYSNICPISGWTGCEVKHSGADVSDPTTFPVTFPASAGTVYGGYVDLVNGKLVVDRAEVTFDESSGDLISAGTSRMTFKLLLPGAKPPQSSAKLTGTDCNQLTEVTQLSHWGKSGTFSRVTIAQQEGMVYFKINDAINTVKQLTAYLASNPLVFVYELATPITYALTPQIIKSLRGVNNIWSNTNGTIDLSYWTH